jgi:hypothetical protein
MCGGDILFVAMVAGTIMAVGTNKQERTGRSLVVVFTKFIFTTFSTTAATIIATFHHRHLTVINAPPSPSLLPSWP